MATSLGSMWINTAEISGGKRGAVSGELWALKRAEISCAFGGQWALQSLFKASKHTMWQCFGRAVEVNYITFQRCEGKYPVYIIVCLSCEIQSQKPYECRTWAKKKSSFIDPESWICWWCIMQIKLFISTTTVSYTCHPQPLRQGLIKNLERWQLPTERGDEGWARYFLYVLWEPLFTLKHVLQASSMALIVWSERALLSPGSDIMRVSLLHMICGSLR